MRRISLALALAGAVAATGCGQTSTSNTGGNRGVAENTFHVFVQNGQGGNTSLAITAGYVTSTPPGIDCGVAPHNVCEFDFDGDDDGGYPPGHHSEHCHADGDRDRRDPVLRLRGRLQRRDLHALRRTNADRYILAQFGSHRRRPPELDEPVRHVANYLSDAFNCQSCHGATLDRRGYCALVRHVPRVAVTRTAHS